MKTLQETLDENTKPAELFYPERDRIRCTACAHRCLLQQGQRGICQVRYVEAGKLRVPWGYVGALQLDPIEKKPFFHALPGSSALSFGMLGCDYHCGYCQNWFTSQALRDSAATPAAKPVSAERLVRETLSAGARVLVSTYNEPLITSEWAMHVFRRAHGAGLITGYVSNGNATREVLEYIRPHTDLYKIDLKGFRKRGYADLGGNLDAVLQAIRWVKELGFWLEVVTLVVPGFNDSTEELTEIAQFLASVSRDIPWHVTAFHPDYKMSDRPSTQLAILLQAAEIGKREGLRYVYVGNLPGSVGSWENTYCHGCNALLVKRVGFAVLENRLREGRCPECRELIPGAWTF
jgi:pyruvate formate lyase activating enzyme